MWQIRVALSLVLCLTITLAGRADRRNSGPRVRIQKKDVFYIADDYNSRHEPIEFEYDEELVERVAVDKRGYVYAVGEDRLSVLKVGRNRQLSLVHTQQFEDTDLESVQTCNGIVTVAVTIDGGDNTEGALLVYRTYNKHMPGDMRLIHAIGLPDGTEHHHLTKDCGRAIVAIEDDASIGVVTFGASKFDEPSVNILDFSEFEGMKDELLEDWLLLGPDGVEGDFADAFDPEWVCLNKKETMAFVNLKENNAVAKVDLTHGMERITSLMPYGLRDFSVTSGTAGADFSDEPTQTALLMNLPIMAAYNPEQISCITIKNQDCIVVAGEGLRVNDGLFNTQIDNANLADIFDGEIDTESFADDIFVMGDDDRVVNDDGQINKLVTTGSRDFSIRCGDDLAIKASTESDLEFFTMHSLLYNLDIEDGSDRLAERYDGSSDEKGPEPETVATKLICGGRYLLMIGITEDPGHLWAFTLDTWDMEAGFKFQDKMHGYKRTDSFLTDEQLYEERLMYLRNAEGIAFIEGKHRMSRRNRGVVSIVVGSLVTSSVETYDLKFECRPSGGRYKYW